MLILPSFYGEAYGSNQLLAYIHMQDLTALYAGLRITIKTLSASTGPVTLNLNNLGYRSVKSSNGNVAKLAEGGVYTLVYDGTAFILQGEGGGVDLGGSSAEPHNVINGATFWSSMSDEEQVGTVQHYGGETIYCEVYNPSPGQLEIKPWDFGTGFIDSDTVFSIADGSYISSSIMAGQNMLGLVGSATNDATAVASDIKSTKTAYVNGNKVKGTYNPPVLRHYSSGVPMTVAYGVRVDFLTLPASPEGVFAICPDMEYFVQIGGYGRLWLVDDGNREVVIITTLGSTAAIIALMFSQSGKMHRNVGGLALAQLNLPAGFNIYGQLRFSIQGTASGETCFYNVSGYAIR
ncbi:hypothetical protein NSS64_32620 [Paenibacillus sp. FSL H8-0122]|uniref:hypothetical protein n=1 Tax=Paenibacillus sp. FSL H8-0122 TaxID=2954510 RepID=UPI0030FD0BC9